jgi:hypothetical protein
MKPIILKTIVFSFALLLSMAAVFVFSEKPAVAAYESVAVATTDYSDVLGDNNAGFVEMSDLTAFRVDFKPDEKIRAPLVVDKYTDVEVRCDPQFLDYMVITDSKGKEIAKLSCKEKIEVNFFRKDGTKSLPANVKLKKK